ncbi:MAG: carboxypeptidase-like regulatory domain-containing protein, partial [Tannerella sp.]|nr:carboxypeptidase-like regulatory domain-containing protein [Tannerella sp.]
MRHHLSIKIWTALFLPFWMCSFLAAGDPDKHIRGVVRDAETSEPLTGATVAVKGTAVGAVTDVDGYYDIQGLRGERQALEFRFLSYRTVEIECETGDSITRLDISMESDDVRLSEV